MSDRFDTLADAVDALTNPMHVRERYEVWHGNNRKAKWWEHRMPSLLDQLDAAAIPGEVYVEPQAEGHHTRPSPAAPARIEAINLSLALTAWAADTVWRCRLPVREDTAANLRAIVGAQLTSDQTHTILGELVGWVYRARVIAGWQRPPFRPNAPCPACDKKGLRVRLDTEHATCVECGQTWDPATIGLLAEHVRTTTSRPVLAP